jgi:hypothetical protein
MSTRGVISRIGKSEGEFAGRYHHSDSMPTGLGAALWSHLHGHFKNDLSKMLRVLIDEHNGWSNIVGADFRLKPGYQTDWTKKNPACYCHGARSEKNSMFTQKDLEGGSDIEWVYAFDEENQRMFVRDVGHDHEEIVDLTQPEPDWDVIACGEDFSRCVHMAWYHKLTPKTCNLSTQTWLGNRPLAFHDAIAFLVDGRRLSSTGCGGDSGFYSTALARENGVTKRFPPNTWVASLKARNGKRTDVAVAKILPNGKFEPLPNIAWVYPPTKHSHQETTVSA